MLPHRKGFKARTVARASGVAILMDGEMKALGSALNAAYSRLERVTGWRGRNDFDVGYQAVPLKGDGIALKVTWTARGVE